MQSLSRELIDIGMFQSFSSVLRFDATKELGILAIAICMGKMNSHRASHFSGHSYVRTHVF